MPPARPILFSSPMIRALIDGRKTQTRRIVKQRTNPHDFLGGLGDDNNDPHNWGFENPDFPSHFVTLPEQRCPYGRPGDLLWVRESFQTPALMDPQYRATPGPRNGHWDPALGPWKPSIHMPRTASRMTLEITDVRVQRIQSVSERDAEKEGVNPSEHGVDPFRVNFAELWRSINGPNSWLDNPWIWALTFKVHKCNVDALLAQKAA